MLETDESKKCRLCKKIWPIRYFGEDKKAKSGYESRCKICLSEKQALHYEKNKKKINIKRALRNKITRDTNRAWVDQYKSEIGCPCGERRTKALQCHHVDRATKVREVSEMISQGFSLEKIKEEITKCIVICANCHLCLEND